MGQEIFYIGNFGFPDRNASGKRVLGNCLLLKALGFTPICIGNGAAGTIEAEGILCHNLRISNTQRVLGKGLQQVIDLIMPYSESLKCVIFYGALFTQKENLALIRWCQKREIPVYYDQVDWFELNWHNPLRAMVRATNHYLMNHRVIPLCDGVICISRYLEEHHRKIGKKTVVIPPLSAVSGCGKTDTAKNADKIRFVYAGTTSDVERPVEQWKDRLDIMFSALASASQLPDTRPFQMDVYGMEQEQYIRMFPKELHEKGEAVLKILGDRVVFHGLVPNAEAMEGIRNAHFTVLIRDKKRSTMAGFPTKVSESLSCGTPVICSDTSDLRKYIQNGVNGYIFENEELESIYEAVLKFSDEQLLTMKRNCQTTPFYCMNFSEEMKRFLEK